LQPHSAALRHAGMRHTDADMTKFRQRVGQSAEFETGARLCCIC
jgi:hypothetical protein